MRTNMLVILMLLPLAPTLSAQSIVASWSNVDIIKIGRETQYKIDGVLLEGPYRLTKSNGNGALKVKAFTIIRMVSYLKKFILRMVKKPVPGNITMIKVK